VLCVCVCVCVFHCIRLMTTAPCVRVVQGSDVDTMSRCVGLQVGEVRSCAPLVLAVFSS